MIKYLLIALQLLVLGVLQLASLFQDDVTIVQKVPAEIKAGEEVTVEITVIKGDLAGLAKLQQELPEGFTASAIQSREATFSYKDNAVKFIWMALPSDAQFTVSYKIRAASDMPSGEVYLGGKFSYVRNNERMMATVPVKKIAVVNPSAPTQPPPPVTGGDTDDAGETGEASTPPPPPAASSSSGEISATRTVSSDKVDPGSEFTVEITVSKGEMSGYAKVQESLPEGFSATGIETAGAIFSFVDRDVKFLWMSLPAGQEFRVSYKVKVGKDVSGVKSIEGGFTYLEGEESKKFVLAPTSVTVGDVLAMDDAGEKTEDPPPPPPADAGDEPKDEPEPEPEPEPVPPPVKKDEPVTPTPPPPVKKEDKPAVTTAPPPQKGVYYRVQICALKTKTVDVAWFRKNRNITEAVYTEMHEGWSKYTVGKLSVYKEARDKREEIRTGNNVQGPFVTAYNNGTRITVQEALMITNQQWFR